VTIHQIQDLVREMCRCTRSGEYAPLLEADISGFLYHLILRRGLCAPRTIHLDTRIIGSENRNDRFDVVVGNVQQHEDGRPAAYPDAVIEIKMFPEEFTDQQHRVHLKHILDDDLTKLGSLQLKTAMRVELVFDQVDYLGGNYAGRKREEVIVTKRNEVAEGVLLLMARSIRGEWQVYLR
jgi:hypothetical protein